MPALAVYHDDRLIRGHRPLLPVKGRVRWTVKYGSDRRRSESFNAHLENSEILGCLVAFQKLKQIQSFLSAEAAPNHLAICFAGLELVTTVEVAWYRGVELKSPWRAGGGIADMLRIIFSVPQAKRFGPFIDRRQ